MLARGPDGTYLPRSQRGCRGDPTIVKVLMGTGVRDKDERVRLWLQVAIAVGTVQLMSSPQISALLYGENLRPAGLTLRFLVLRKNIDPGPARKIKIACLPQKANDDLHAKRRTDCPTW